MTNGKQTHTYICADQVFSDDFLVLVTFFFPVENYMSSRQTQD